MLLCPQLPLPGKNPHPSQQPWPSRPHQSESSPRSWEGGTEPPDGRRQAWKVTMTQRPLCRSSRGSGSGEGRTDVGGEKTELVGLAPLPRHVGSTLAAQIWGNGSLGPGRGCAGAAHPASGGRAARPRQLTWTTEMWPCSTANVSEVQCRLSGWTDGCLGELLGTWGNTTRDQGFPGDIPGQGPQAPERAKRGPCRDGEQESTQGLSALGG